MIYTWKFIVELKTSAAAIAAFTSTGPPEVQLRPGRCIDSVFRSQSMIVHPRPRSDNVEWVFRMKTVRVKSLKVVKFRVNFNVGFNDSGPLLYFTDITG